jgi:hypothetical protein
MTNGTCERQTDMVTRNSNSLSKSLAKRAQRFLVLSDTNLLRGCCAKTCVEVPNLLADPTLDLCNLTRVLVFCLLRSHAP